MKDRIHRSDRGLVNIRGRPLLSSSGPEPNSTGTVRTVTVPGPEPLKGRLKETKGFVSPDQVSCVGQRKGRPRENVLFVSDRVYTLDPGDFTIV